MNDIFQTGDRVYSIGRGWGLVQRCQFGLVVVKFDSGVNFGFTFDGKEVQTQNRTLFFTELEIPPTALEKKRLPDLAVDAKVWVKSGNNPWTSSWYPKHFAGWASDGNIMVFGDGKTSFTALTTQLSKYGEWKVDTGVKPE